MKEFVLRNGEGYIVILSNDTVAEDGYCIRHDALGGKATYDLLSSAIDSAKELVINNPGEVIYVKQVSNELLDKKSEIHYTKFFDSDYFSNVIEYIPLLSLDNEHIGDTYFYNHRPGKATLDKLLGDSVISNKCGYPSTDCMIIYTLLDAIELIHTLGFRIICNHSANKDELFDMASKAGLYFNKDEDTIRFFFRDDVLTMQFSIKGRPIFSRLNITGEELKELFNAHFTLNLYK